MQPVAILDSKMPSPGLSSLNLEVIRSNISIESRPVLAMGKVSFQPS